MNKTGLIIIAIMLFTVSSITGYWLSRNTGTASTGDFRPSYCINEKCIDPFLFSDLPKYPSNFGEVWTLLYPTSHIGLAENFSLKYPDDNYYKQPEFYAMTFKDTGIQFYTVNTTKFAFGSGCYPSDISVSNIKSGESFPIVTYCHAGWSIEKYQAFKLTPSFPSSASLNGDIITQNPDAAAGCFVISVTPDNIVLAPTYPIFYLGWTQKITIILTAKCSGNWVIDFAPTPADTEFLAQMNRELGIYQVSQMVGGGTFQANIQV